MDLDEEREQGGLNIPEAQGEGEEEGRGMLQGEGDLGGWGIGEEEGRGTQEGEGDLGGWGIGEEERRGTQEGEGDLEGWGIGEEEGRETQEGEGDLEGWGRGTQEGEGDMEGRWREVGSSRGIREELLLESCARRSGENLSGEEGRKSIAGDEDEDEEECFAATRTRLAGGMAGEDILLFPTGANLILFGDGEYGGVLEHIGEEGANSG